MTGANRYPDHLFITKNRSVHKLLSLVGSKQVIDLCCQLVGVVIIGVSVNEPHIDNFAVNFISVVRRAVNNFLLVFCVSLLRHACHYVLH